MDSTDRAPSPESHSETVLVTGGSGFIASYLIAQLLAAGYRVRTTVRSLAREAEVREAVRAAGADADGRLAFVTADLERDAGWAEAVAGCRFVQHVASPFPPGVPRHEDDLIVPARDGTLRVLRAARDVGVARVVLTSSFAAIGYGHGARTAPFDETVWTDLSVDVSAYVKSKTIAERAAWDFVAREGAGLELSVVNPTVVFGPVLGPDYSTSIAIIRRLLEGAVPGCPRLSLGVVDVRDVADLHVRAMTHPAAAGERFLAVAGDFMTIVEIARTLRDGMGAAGRNVPARELPDLLVRIASLRDASLRPFLSELGKPRNATNEKAKRVLGWSPRSNAESVIASGESLVRLGIAKTPAAAASAS